MPYNWGFKGLSTGPSVNHLTIDAVDPGAGTQETKACLVNVVKVRDGRPRRRGPAREGHDGRAGSSTPIKTTLIDVTNCIGCRACQVACKQWNDREGEQTELLRRPRASRTRRRSARRRYTLISFHEFADETAPGGLRLRLRDAALPALPRAGVRLRLPDHGALPAGRRPGGLRRREVHRLPLLHAGPARGACPRRTGTRSRPKIQKCTHCADRAEPAAPRIAQRLAPLTRPRVADLQGDHAGSGLREGLPGRRARLRRPRGDARRSPPAHRQPPGPVRGPHLRREGGGRHERALPVRGAVREARLPRRRRQAVPRVLEGVALHRRPAGGHGPRGRCSAMAYAASASAGRPVGRRQRVPPGRSHADHPEFERAPAAAADPVQLGAARADGVRRRLAGGAVRARPRAAARTSPTPTPGGCGSSSTWSGSRSPPAPSPPPASSTSSSERTCTRWAARPCSWAC